VATEKAKKFAPAAPINQIGHMKGLATADDIMPYTPNNDTVYSGALLELVEEPVILTVPEILDRYWSVEVADCYTENLFYLGTRATGGKGGQHAFVGPNWKGKLPEGVIEHRVPYNSLMFALRIGVLPNDDADLKKVIGLQEKVALTSLSNWGDPGKFGIAAFPYFATGRNIMATWRSIKHSLICWPRIPLQSSMRRLSCCSAGPELKLGSPSIRISWMSRRTRGWFVPL